MKLPNGFGTVYKLSGKRRNPYIARKTIGWEVIDEKAGTLKQLYETIGYYPTRAAGLEALAAYNSDPYDLTTHKITFSEVYEKWSDIHFNTIVPSAARTWKSAYTYCSDLHDMKMIDIRVNHLESAIKNASVGNATKGRMKSLYNMMYRYCMKHEIVEKNYAQLCDSIKRPAPEIQRIPFADNEITLLFDNLNFSFTDMVLIGIYSGWRPQELAVLKVKDIDLENKTYTGGLKTDAGKNRLVPIHPFIFDLVKTNYENALRLNSEYLFNDENGQQGTHLTYDKYRGRFKKVMKRFGLIHTPHDTRHTFITNLKAIDINEYLIKLLVGHAIQDVTEKTYTHRTIEELRIAISKIEKPKKQG